VRCIGPTASRVGGIASYLSEAHGFYSRLAIEFALQGAEIAHVLQMARADRTLGSTNSTLGRPRLRPSAEKEDFGAVYHI